MPQQTDGRDAFTFPATLRELREARRITQSRLADRAGVDHSYVSRLESGTRRPQRAMIGALARALDLPPDERDELLVAAGFQPGDVASLLRDEPDVVRVLELLRSDVGAMTKELMRQQLRLMVEQVRSLSKEVA